MRILILDDDTKRHEVFKTQLIGCDLVHCETFEEFKKALEGPKFDGVCLDCDLNDFGRRSMTETTSMYGSHQVELTGVDAAMWLTRLPVEKRPDKTLIHSWNPEGAAEMARILNEHGFKDVLVKEFEWPS
jgi:CheY-like chemotaxis protein